MASTIVAGLDIGSSSIRLVVAEMAHGLSPDGRPVRRPRVLAAVKQEARGLRRGYITNFDETVENLKLAIAEAEKQSRLHLKSVFLGIGGITLEAKAADAQVIVSKGDLEINEVDLERARAACEAALGDFPNRRILHAVPLGYKLDGKKIFGRPDGLRGNKLEVKMLFIHCLSQHFKDLVRAVEATGLRVEDVIAAPVAASLPTLTTTQKAAGVALANIGSQTTSVITFEDGGPVALAVLPIGSNDVTNDIALGLRVSIEEAERIKLDPTAALTWKRKLDEIVEARVTDMLELIDSHLKKIGRSGLLPAGLTIVGGGASLELERLGKNTLRLPTRLWRPEDSHFKPPIKDAGWVVAYGLCLCGLEAERSHSWPTRLHQIFSRFMGWFRDFWP